MIWPVPESFIETMPRRSERGGFWEDRGDRRHTGVDIYAPAGSAVVTCDEGEVVQIALFTLPEMTAYWCETWFYLIRQKDGLFVRYAEMGQVYAREGQRVKAGERIGSIGCVLNLEKIDASAPRYIQQLKDEGHPSMLHLEVLSTLPQAWPDYRGGNWFGRTDVNHFLDPQVVFIDAEKTSRVLPLRA